MQIIHIISTVAKLFNIKELSLFKEYKNYVDIFSIKETTKHNKLEDAKHSINLILKKNLLYRSIYNLFAQKLVILQEYIYFALNKS